MDLLKMFSLSFFISLFCVCVATKNIEGSQAVLQKTVELLFTERSQTLKAACLLPGTTKRQNKLCRRTYGLPNALSTAREQAISACEEAFKYDRWNCSLKFNRKVNKTIFTKIYRETAFVYSLMAASITHAVARACSSGDMVTCSCLSTFGKNSSWKGSGCGDDFRYGKRIAKNFLDLKHAGVNQSGELLKQDAMVGINAIGEQLKEVCKCHGFSGSCTTKTCWKRLGPFNSAMGLLKKHYHHAAKRKVGAKVKKVKKRGVELVYLHKTPDLCARTVGRVCKDRNNCATLCCTRGFATAVRNVTSRCGCRMVNCCFVECDTCVEEVDFFTCNTPPLSPKPLATIRDSQGANVNFFTVTTRLDRQARVKNYAVFVNQHGGLSSEHTCFCTPVS